MSLSVENERDDTGQDGRTRLARPNSQARTQTGTHKQDMKHQPYPIDPFSAICDGHTDIVISIIDPSLGGSMRVA